MKDNWQIKKLDEVFYTIRGISFSKDSRRNELEKGYVACLRTANVQQTIDWKNLLFAPIDRVKRKEQFLRKGDILMSTANSLELLGKVAMVNKLPYKSTLGTFILCLRTKNYSQLSKFYFYQLRGQEFLSQIRANAKTTTNISNISVSQLKKLDLKVTDITTQHQIGQKLDSLFSKIDAGEEGLRLVEKQLEVYRQAVLKKAFEGGKYQMKRIKDIAQINPKKEVLSDKLIITFLPMKSIKEVVNKFDGRELRRVEKVKKGYTQFKNKDILMAKITPCMENGKFVVVDNLMNGWGYGSTEYHVLRVNDNMALPEYLFFFIIQEKFRLNAKKEMTGTAGHMRVPKEFIEEVIIPVPPLNQQVKIIQDINKSFSLINKVKNNIKNSFNECKILHKSILKKAFSGELI